jgi:phage regulator Rha-like protein
MSKLIVPIEIINQQPRVSLLTIADSTNNKYTSLNNLVRTYKSDIEEFGEVLTYDFKSQVGKQSKTVAMLNEQQATFLMTLLQNSPQVVAFKKELVKAFFNLRAETTPIKQKALSNQTQQKISSISLSDPLFKINKDLVKEGTISKKLSPNEIRVLSTLISSYQKSDQNYFVMTDAQIGKESSVPTKSIANSFVNLDDVHGLVKRVNKRNYQGLMERRIFISETVFAELNLEHKSKSVVTPTSPNMAELEKLIKKSIGEALEPLFEQRVKTSEEPVAKKIKALKHAIQIAKEQMVKEPHLVEECMVQIQNGEVYLAYLLEQA